jgi:hypothetical protein
VDNFKLKIKLWAFRGAILFSSLFGAGCATQGVSAGPVVVPEPVKIMVPVPCVVSVPKRPNFASDQTLNGYDDYQLTLALWMDHEERKNYIEQLEASTTDCKTISTPKS